MSQEHESEHHRPVFDTWFRASVFGFSDGLITNISLILGFVGANPGHSVVRLVGLTGLVAGAFILASLVKVFNIKELQPAYRLALLTALSFLLIAPLPLLLRRRS